MTFPAVTTADTKTGSATSNSTTLTLTYPTNLATGDLILAFVGRDGAEALGTWPAGWVRAGAGSTCCAIVAKKKSDGTETGNFNVTSLNSEQGPWRVVRIPAALWEGTLGTTFSNVASSDGSVVQVTSSEGSDANPNPDSNNPTNWASEDTLWIAVSACDAAVTYTGFPSSYTQEDHTTAGGHAASSGGSNGAGLGVAYRQLNASSEDPGTFTLSGSEQWRCITIAVRPSGTVTTTKTQTGVARITATTTKTQTGKASIQVTASQTRTGLARIQKIVTATQNGLARIQKVVNQTINGVANIRATTSRTQTGVARVQKSVNQTTTGLATIIVATNRTQTGLARVTATGSQTQTGKARIQNAVTRNLQGVARIQTAVNQTQQGTSRIQKLVNQTINGLARITVAALRTATGVARIQKTVGQTVTGVAKIEAAGNTTTNRDQTGKARITAATTQNLTGRARLTVSVGQTQLGKAAIRVTTNRTQTGVANILVAAEKLITGVARVTVATLRTIAGTARVTSATSQNTTGTGRIQISVTQDISGVARIIDFVPIEAANLNISDRALNGLSISDVTPCVVSDSAPYIVTLGDTAL